MPRAGTAEGPALVALGRDMGYEFQLRIWVHSSSAKAIVTRLGLGKVRHMEVAFLWAQEAFRRKLFEFRKIAVEKHPADVLAKEVSMREMKDKIESVGGFFASTEVSRVLGECGTCAEHLPQTVEVIEASPLRR